MAKFLSPDSRSDWNLGHAQDGLASPESQFNIGALLNSRGVAEADILVSRQFVHEVHDLHLSLKFIRRSTYSTIQLTGFCCCCCFVL